MTMNDPNRVPGVRGNSAMGWLLGAIVVIVILGGIAWMMNGTQTGTATRDTDTNTGSISQSAPQPGSTNGPGPGAPSRP
jgi:hypothetical protein